MGKSRLGTGYNYPNEKIYDEAKQLITRPVSSVGPRGLEPQYFLDEFGSLLEKEWLQKVYLYKERQALSEVTDKAKILELIDERTAEIIFQAKEYLATVSAIVTNDAERTAIIESISTIISLAAAAGGVAITGGGLTGIIKYLIPKAAYGISKEKFTKKLAALELEANYLQITKQRLSNFYQNVGNVEKTIEEIKNNATATQNAVTNDNLLIAALVVAVALFLRKKLKKRK